MNDKPKRELTDFMSVQDSDLFLEYYIQVERFPQCLQKAFFVGLRRFYECAKKQNSLFSLEVGIDGVENVGEIQSKIVIESKDLVYIGESGLGYESWLGVLTVHPNKNFDIYIGEISEDSEIIKFAKELKSLNHLHIVELGITPTLFGTFGNNSSVMFYLYPENLFFKNPDKAKDQKILYFKFNDVNLLPEAKRYLEQYI